MGALFSAAGAVAGASISASATKEATRMQIEALEKQAKRMYAELDPEVLKGYTLDQDIANLKQRLALQAETDPSLLAARYLGQDKLLEGLMGLGGGDSDAIASLAAQSAKEASPELTQLKNQLIDSALAEIDAGASLPPGVQAELVKAGLEQGGLVSGSVDPRGIAGNATRKMVGERALSLQAERQGRAAQLAQTAAGLEQARTSLLGNLFPQLQGQQASNIGLAQGGLTTSSAMLPNAGLTGADILNITGARVGAGNTIAMNQADAAGRSAMALGNIWGNAIGSGTAAIGSSDSPIGAKLDQWGSKLLGV